MTEVAIVEVQETRPAKVGSPDPMSLIELALKQNRTGDEIGKLVDLQERIMRVQAEQDFAAALAHFQARCPRVFKRRESKGAKWTFAYASLDDIMREIAPLLAECRIAVSFDTEQTDATYDEQGKIKTPGVLTVIVRVRVGAYFEDRSFRSPMPHDMSASDPQIFGSALSYLKRYALCAALNIVVTDDPDDDAASVFEKITPGEAAELKALYEAKVTNADKFWDFAETPSRRFEDISRRMFPQVKDALQRKARA